MKKRLGERANNVKSIPANGDHLCWDATVEYRRLIFFKKNRVEWGERELLWGQHL